MNRFLPPHWDFRNQLQGFSTVFIIHTLWTMGFYSRLSQWLEKLALPTSLVWVYPSFWTIVDNGMVCIYLVLFYLIVWACIAFSTFFDGGKNIYRLRRMPFGHGVFARCLALPLYGAVLTALWSGLLLAIQYWVYCANRPL